MTSAQKFLIALAFFCLFLAWPFGRVAAAEAIEIFFFQDPDCSLCDQMADALAVLDAKYPELTVISLDIRAEETNLTIFQDLMELYGLQTYTLPTVVVGSTVFDGFDASVVNGIEQAIVQCRNNPCISPRKVLNDYYDSLIEAKSEKGKADQGVLFWTIFLLAWPILGAIAIILVWRKYSRK